MKKPVFLYPLPSLCIALAILCLSGLKPGDSDRLKIEVNGTIVESHDFPATGTSRYITRYVILQEDGRRIAYTAGPTEASLGRSMPVGTKIHKQRGHYSWDKNGEKIYYSNIASAVLIFIALGFTLWSFFQTFGARLWNKINGIIVESQDLPITGASRYITRYVVLQENGRRMTYIADPVIHAGLPVSMPVGTKIYKQRWCLSWERNGETINDFPILFYALLLTIAIGLILLDAFEWRQMRL
jgi:hypothetical protein